jgi:hypothetical protein
MIESFFIMGASKSNFRTFGVVYIVLGLWSFFYFTAIFLEGSLASSVWDFVPRGIRGAYILPSVILIVSQLSSVVLTSFGFVLMVRGIVWVFHGSIVLSSLLLVCYLFVLFYPIVAFFG